MSSRWLAVPFPLGLLLLIAGGFAMQGESDFWMDTSDVLQWLGVASWLLGIALLVLYALTRFVVWAARRE